MIFQIYLDGGGIHVTKDGEFKSLSDLEAKIKNKSAILCTRALQFTTARLQEAAEEYLKEVYPELIGDERTEDPEFNHPTYDLFSALRNMPKSRVEYILHVRPAKVVAIGIFEEKIF